MINIINGCDRIEKKYNDLLCECCHLQVEIKNDLMRNELQTVENFIRKLPPVFTAAGFFRINQGLYSSLCSTLVSYLIVIIQFNSVNVGSTNTNCSQNVMH